MKYITTRGGSTKLNFSEVLLGGLAPEGGLYLPEHYPNFTDDELNDMRDMSYQDLAFYIFEKFIDDIPSNDLREIVNKTYSAEIFSSSSFRLCLCFITSLFSPPFRPDFPINGQLPFPIFSVSFFYF